MIERKNAIFTMVILLQIVLCIVFIVSIIKGAQHIFYMHSEHKKQKIAVAVLEEEIKNLYAHINMWNLDFTKEKFAREKLHMARKNDIVYIIS